MFSSILTNVSPSGKEETVHFPSSVPIDLAIAFAKGIFEVPLKIFTMVILKIKDHLLGGPMCADCNNRDFSCKRNCRNYALTVPLSVPFLSKIFNFCLKIVGIFSSFQAKAQVRNDRMKLTTNFNAEFFVQSQQKNSMAPHLLNCRSVVSIPAVF